MIDASMTRRADARIRGWLLLVAAALLTAFGAARTTGGAWPTPADVAPAKTGFSAAGLAKLDARMYQWDRNAGKLAPMPDPPGRDFFRADHVESGGGGLVSSIRDYARFAQMLLNKGTLDGATILKPETVELMTRNHIGDLRVGFDGNAATSANSGSGFGLDFSVIYDPLAAKTPQGKGTYSWFGIAGTWFWIDPTNDLFYIGMIQRRGGAGPGAVNFRTESVNLVYEALASGAGS